MDKLLLLCETSNFKTFTRRATVEAIKKIYPQTFALANIPIRNLINKNLSSDEFLRISFILNYKIPVFDTDIFYGLNKIKKFDKADNVIALSSPRQHFIFDHIKLKSRIVAILSDPYHLMGYSYENTKKILSRAEIVFATSQNLAGQYLNNYFPGIRFNVVYWPNTVDTNIWDIQRLEVTKKDDNKKVVVGFAGNIMEVTDLNLLDYITSVCTDCIFEIAGKVRITSETDISQLRKIFKKNNVRYLGFIDYENLPQKVYEWDIGILIDKQNELSSYHHHNKLYQYLALGKPVVVHRNHADYDYLNDVVFIANDYKEFVKYLYATKKYIKNPTFIQKAKKAAYQNNADVRARQFIKDITSEA